MNKELEAFNNICFHIDMDTTDYAFNGNYEDDSKIIEKALKALEIIKNKQVDVGWFIKCYNDYSNDKDRLMMYNQLSIDDKGRDLTQEEYDLLREVFYE